MRDNRNQKMRKRKPIKFKYNNNSNSNTYNNKQFQFKRFPKGFNAGNEAAKNASSNSYNPVNNKNDVLREKKVDLSSKKTAIITSSYAAGQELKPLLRSEQTITQNKDISSAFSLYQNMMDSRTENFSNTVKCCCQCACGGTKRKPRRKLSSPYLGDFSKAMHFSGGNCSNSIKTELLDKTVLSQHEKSFIKTTTNNSGVFASYEPDLSAYMSKSERLGINSILRLVCVTF